MTTRGFVKFLCLLRGTDLNIIWAHDRKVGSGPVWVDVSVIGGRNSRHRFRLLSFAPGFRRSAPNSGAFMLAGTSPAGGNATCLSGPLGGGHSELREASTGDGEMNSSR